MIKYKKSKILKSKLINKDKRGFFETLFDDDIRNVSLLRSNKNSIRSNHYHLKDWHYMYVLEGSIHYFFRGIKAKKINYLHVKKNNIIFTPPLEIHTTFFDQKTSLLVANNLKRSKKDYEEDLVRYNLIDIKEIKILLKK
jgi:hypothetical protein